MILKLLYYNLVNLKKRSCILPKFKKKLFHKLYHVKKYMINMILRLKIKSNKKSAKYKIKLRFLMK